MISRTPQAAIGWGLALVFLPYIAIPLFLVFGESRFSGYTLAGAEGNAELDAAIRQAQRALAPFRSPLSSKSIPTRSDWESVSADFLQAVETLAVY